MTTGHRISKPVEERRYPLNDFSEPWVLQQPPGSSPGGISVDGFDSRLRGITQRAQPLLRSLIEFRNALKIDPNQLPAHSGLATLYLRKKRIVDASWEFSEVVRLDPQNAYAREELAYSCCNGSQTRACRRAKNCY